MQKYAAIILAAGKGTRMNEGEASPIPKVMFEANGKPIIHYAVEAIERAGIEKIILVVGYKKEMVMEYLGNQAEYAVQDEQLGTGHAVMVAKEKAGEAEAVIVFYGDHALYRPESINNLIETYENPPAGGKPTIAMLSVIFDDPEFWAFGRIIRNPDGEVQEIVEQKDCNDEQLKIKESNPGFYIFDAKWLWENINKLKTENVQKEYYLTDIIGIAKEQGKRIIAIPVPEYTEALGINTPEHLKQAEEILKKRYGNL